jgi:actin-related protein 5
MAPSAIHSPSQETGQPSELKPPRLYPTKEAHFERFLEPQPDGYQRAVARGPGRAAIVIDNGNSEFAPVKLHL